ncbi:triose-phosphate isomerase [Bacteriovorax sp. Seq25_V]|uniref:triose-phosphate isomerase n=1 Tax=Bacteriovorax sp. Seq25_V TaxID=1201288 RepID=UPI00038A2D25|nr:triose-phosphate isomerase [Bacteriovorax sp. Seq25_V]EQC45667.1 triose-phosphate isomerase [Bacteriovorax sp. Seq25_V]
MRKTLVVGNWKMNQSLGDIEAFFTTVKASNFTDEAWIAPQALHLSKLIELAPKNFKTGAQNCSYENSGAFTGEVSPTSLKELGCEFVILGHSERRAIFKETHEELNLKVKKALVNNLKVIFCIGETLEERESGKIEAVLGEQLKKGLQGVSSSDVIVAYEPVWAIGTGVTATPAQAQETHEFVRKFLKEETELNAEETLILYGGSVKPDNAKELFSCADIDGGLVGGASLKAESFMGLYGK